MVCIAEMLDDANARKEFGCGGGMMERYMDIVRVTDGV